MNEKDIRALEPEIYKDLAYVYTYKDNRDSKRESPHNLDLGGAFTWQNSLEGGDLWAGFYYDDVKLPIDDIPIQPVPGFVNPEFLNMQFYFLQSLIVRRLHNV